MFNKMTMMLIAAASAWASVAPDDVILPSMANRSGNVGRLFEASNAQYVSANFAYGTSSFPQDVEFVNWTPGLRTYGKFQNVAWGLGGAYEGSAFYRKGVEDTGYSGHGSAYVATAALALSSTLSLGAGYSYSQGSGDVIQTLKLDLIARQNGMVYFLGVVPLINWSNDMGNSKYLRQSVHLGLENTQGPFQPGVQLDLYAPKGSDKLGWDLQPYVRKDLNGLQLNGVLGVSRDLSEYKIGTSDYSVSVLTLSAGLAASKELVPNLTASLGLKLAHAMNDQTSPAKTVSYSVQYRSLLAQMSYGF